jgi:hypothetical protein
MSAATNTLAYDKRNLDYGCKKFYRMDRGVLTVLAWTDDLWQGSLGKGNALYD